MSCFVTTQKHINQIISNLGRCEFSGNGQKHTLFNTVYNWDCDKLERFGRELWILNHKSYRNRYSTKESGFYKFRPSLWLSVKLSPVELLKSMQCLSYQCDEIETAPAALVMLRNIIAELQNKIIDNMPEYKAAAWGEK